MASRIVMATATVCASVVLCTVLIELSFYWLNSGRPPLNPWERRIRAIVGPQAPEAQPSVRTSALRSSIGERPVLQAAPQPEWIRKSSETDNSRIWLPGMFSGMHSDWPLFPRKLSGRSLVTVHGTGEVVFDVALSTDEWGRRETPNPQPQRRQRFVAVFGCSIAFGHGVDDNATLPSQIAAHAPDFRVYNFAIPGGSPREALLLLENADFEKSVAGQAGYGLYVLIPDHFRRIRPSISYVYWSRLHAPFFEVGAGGRLERRESYSRSHPYAAALYWALGWSQTLTYLRLDVPHFYGDTQVKLLALHLKRLADGWKSRFPDSKFAVVIWPWAGAELYGPLKGYLDALSVPYLDYGSVEIGKLIPGRVSVSPYDAHPGPQAHALLGEQIAADLGLTARGP